MRAFRKFSFLGFAIITAFVCVALPTAITTAAPGDLIIRIVDPAPVLYEQFGSSIAPFGGGVLIGARFKTNGLGDTPGIAYVFSNTGGLQDTIDPAQGDSYFGYSVATSGTAMLIGAPGYPSSAFYINGPTTQPIADPEPSQSGDFGFSVAFHGSNFLVSSVSFTGSVYLLNPAGDPIFTFTQPPVDFGRCITTVGQIIVIGAPSYEVNDIPIGRVYLYDGNSASPTYGQLLRTIDRPGGTGTSRFGASLAALGNNLLVGDEYFDVEDTENAGDRVFLFDLNPLSPTFGGLLRTIPNPVPQDFGPSYFGAALAVQGDNILVSAPDLLVAANLRGAVYVIDGNLSSSTFGLPKLAITNPTTNTFGGTNFGGSLAFLQNGTIAIAAISEDIGGLIDAGAVYLYEGNPTGLGTLDLDFEINAGLSDFSVTVEGPPGVFTNFQPSAFGTLRMRLYSMQNEIVGAQITRVDLRADDISSNMLSGKIPNGSPFTFSVEGARAVIGDGRGVVGPAALLSPTGNFTQMGSQVEFDGSAMAQIGDDMWLQEGGPGSGQIPLDFSGTLSDTPGGYQLTAPFNIVRTVANGSGDFEPRIEASGILMMSEQGPPPTPTPTATPSPTPSPSPTPFSNAVIISHTIPTQIPASHSVPVNVTIQNTGNTIWSAAANFSLAMITDPCSMGPVRIYLPAGTLVNPGQSHTFSLILNVPGTLGDCPLELRMVQELVEFFGQTLSLTPNVVAPVNNATVTGHTIPATMSPNQSLHVGITMRNTGNTPWFEGTAYSLAVTGVPCMIPQAARIYVRPGDIVLPNQNYQFITRITAPANLGGCAIDFRMVEEFVEFFGVTLNSSIAIQNPSNAGSNWSVYE